MRIVDLPPSAPVLMEATRAIGYSLEAALADIVDNSVAAKAGKVDILFFPIDEAYIAVVDDGWGMSTDELTAAMRYGSRHPVEKREESDLGRYGLGLKTASLSQCRKLTVVSKKQGRLSGARWDLNYVAKTGQWSLVVLDEDDFHELPGIDRLKENSAGTLVVWQELDRLEAGESQFETAMGQRMDAVREHLSLVFHRYLAGEQGLKRLSITINDLPLVPFDPFMTSKSTQVMDDETIVIQGSKIVVRPYILPHLSKLKEAEIRMLGGKDGLRRQQGFYVYRNKRLLVWGTWFRMMRQGDLSKLARVRVDIPNSLDALWTLDIKKSTAVPPELVRRNLAVTLEKIAESSKRTWTYRGKKETDDSKVHVWNRLKTRQGGILYEVNREHPLVSMIASSGPQLKHMLMHLLTQIERNLPLNSLYVDLNNDERITNDTETTKTELIELWKQLTSTCQSDIEVREMTARLVTVEPFSDNPDLVQELLRKVG